MSDDRTKADKAWEARQEAARYRIFNAATNAAEARPTKQMMRPILESLDRAGNAAEAAAAEITGYKTYADLFRGVGHTPQTVLAQRMTASVGKLPDLLRRFRCRIICVATQSPDHEHKKRLTG